MSEGERQTSLTGAVRMVHPHSCQFRHIVRDNLICRLGTVFVPRRLDFEDTLRIDLFSYVQRSGQLLCILMFKTFKEECCFCSNESQFRSCFIWLLRVMLVSRRRLGFFGWTAILEVYFRKFSWPFEVFGSWSFDEEHWNHQFRIIHISNYFAIQQKVALWLHWPNSME